LSGARFIQPAVPKNSTQHNNRLGLLKGTVMFRSAMALLLMIITAATWAPVLAFGHREAPIAVFDTAADITDVFAFRSYAVGSTDKITLILCTNGFLEPGNGPNWSPFDPEILYEIKIDNNNDGVEDIVFQFRFTTETRLPNLWQAYLGAGAGITAPGNSPPPVPPGALVVPPQVTSFSSIGLGQRQSYTVTMIKAGIATPITGAGAFFVLPANVGPRTMDYGALFNQAIFHTASGISLFAGTTDDASFGNVGGLFDTFNTSLSPFVLSAAQDAANVNFASDTLSGYGVNSIAVEVPIAMLTRTGAIEAATSPSATIGVWGSTSRPRTTLRRAPLPAVSSGVYSQIQRMGNPFINALVIGMDAKDRFSMDQPKNDAQFGAAVLDPMLARVVNALTGGVVAIPTPPRNDLLPLVTYAPPIAAAGTTAGPFADMLRLNTGVAPTNPAFASRLGLLGGDAAGFPNGRRLFDDVLDITLRIVAGGVLAGAGFPNTVLGDGVNVNDVPYRTSFPYLGDAPSGKSRRHIDPGEAGCTAGAGAPCLP
jgi:hypothetical protein